MILRPALILHDKSNILRPRSFGTLCPSAARRVEGGCMDKNQGYTILRVAMLENGRGFALGEHPTAPSRYVTWAWASICRRMSRLFRAGRNS